MAHAGIQWTSGIVSRAAPLHLVGSMEWVQRVYGVRSCLAQFKPRTIAKPRARSLGIGTTTHSRVLGSDVDQNEAYASETGS